MMWVIFVMIGLCCIAGAIIGDIAAVPSILHIRSGVDEALAWVGLLFGNLIALFYAIAFFESEL